MSLLLSVADGSLFYNSGRGIQQTDENEKVCVVNARYAQENGLSVGGTIELYDLGEGYISEEKDSCAGIESGFPFLKDVGEALEREEVSLGSFTIIGLYSFVDRRMKGNPYLYSYNDIFVPAGVLQGQADCDREPRPYTYSFRVQGKDYDRFLDLVEDPLMKKGYALKLSNSDWPSVQSMYTQMTGRYRMLFGGAVFAMVMLLLVYNVLLVVLYRQEFALRCVLGTPKRLARRSFTIPLLGNWPSCLWNRVCHCFLVGKGKASRTADGDSARAGHGSGYHRKDACRDGSALYRTFLWHSKRYDRMAAA